MDGYVTIETNLNTSKVDKQIALLEEKLEGLEEEYDALKKATPFERQTEELIKLGSEIDRTRNKVNKLKAKQGFDFSGVGNGIANATKKLTKFGLALFGIRATYGFIRGAVSTLTSQNDELANKIDAIKNALAQSIAPVIEWIVNLVSKLIDYLGTLIKELSGYDIFAKSSKSLKSGVNSAKELKKQLSGVDELNVISGNTSGGTGGSGSGLGLNNGAVKNAQKTAGLLKQVYNTSRDDFINMLEDTMTWSAKIFDIALFDIGKGIEKFFAGFGKWGSGVYDIIKGLINDDKKLLYQGLMNAGLGGVEIIEGIRETLFGVLELIGSGIVFFVEQVIEKIKTQWKEFWTLIPIAILLIWGAKIKPTIDGIKTKALDFFAGLWEGIKIGFNLWWENAKKTLIGAGMFLGNTVDGIIFGIGDTIASLFDGMFNAGKGFVDGIIKIFKGDFKNGLISIFKGIGNFFIGVINTLINAINLVASPIRALIVGIGKVVGKSWTMDNIKIPTIPKLARGGIVNNPGHGVMMGSYIAGENGPEAVLPLTDDVLDRLGEAIARHQNINATIPIYVGNRQIAREIRQINEQDAFASNGG